MRRLLLAIALAPSFAACAATSPSAPLSRTQLCAKRDSVVARVPGTTIDDQFETLAQLLPGGFGGLTSSFMYMTRPAEIGALRATAQVLGSCPAGTLPYLLSVRVLPVRQGRYDWIALRGWYRALRAGAPPDWNSADMDEALNQLAFTFPSDSALSMFRAYALATGVPASALALSVRGPLVTLSVSPRRPSNVR